MIITLYTRLLKLLTGYASEHKIEVKFYFVYILQFSIVRYRLVFAAIYKKDDLFVKYLVLNPNICHTNKIWDFLCIFDTNTML